MGRIRTKKYLDIPLKATELVRLKKGYKVAKLVKGQNVSLYVDGKDRKKEREIARLKTKIKELESKK
jgi:hypothetical protein